MDIKTIVRMRFGSHLYGTNTPESDLDIKAIYLPTVRDILLQRVKPAVTGQREKAKGEKNTSDDTDFEAYSPAKFLNLLSEGQTVALDMLFAPPEVMIETPDAVWREIQELAPRLFSKKTTAFVSYCRQQARKYGVKGERLTAVRLALEELTQIEAVYGSNEKLGVAAKELTVMTEANPLLNIVQLPNPDGSLASYFDVAGKKAIFSASIKAARAMTQNLFDEFGARTRAAEANQGVDWKAMSHSVRIARQAVEFLQTGQIIFPRPDAAHLLAIKRGQLRYDAVGAEIEALLSEVEVAAQNSNLPEDCDPAIADDFVVRLYEKIVKEGLV